MAGESGVDIDTPMTVSVTFDGDKQSGILAGEIDLTTTQNRRTKTFFVGEAGEELSDYAHIYIRADGVNPLHINRYYYGDSYKAAIDSVSGVDRLAKVIVDSCVETPQ